MSTDPAVKTQTGSSAVTLPSLQPDPSLGGGGAITVSKDVENSSAEKVAVQWENRAPITRAQTVWLVLYLIAVVLFFIDGFMAVFSRNVALVTQTSQPCPNGWARRHDDFPPLTTLVASPYCMSADLTSQWDKCMTDLGKKLNKDQKALVVQTEKGEESDWFTRDMWDILGSNVGLCLVLFPVFLGAAVAWFFALKHIPFQVVYGTIGLGVAGLILMAIIFFKGGGAEAGVVPILMAVGIVIATYLCRDHIAFTCRTITAACTILKDRPHVFGACFVVKVCWLAALLFLIWFNSCASGFAEVEQETVRVDAKGQFGGENQQGNPLHDEILCQITHKESGFLGAFSLLCFLWIITWFEMAAVLICSVTMGGYFFHRDDALAPQSPGFVALGWAFSSSAGAVAESSFTITMSNWATRWLSFNIYTCPCMCNPFWWILFIIFKCFQGTIEMFSRFSLIMHGFHGGGMFTEGTRRPPKEALVKHLGTALVNAAVGQNVLVSAAGLVSTIVGLGTWAWLDTSEKLNFLPVLVNQGGIAALLFPAYWYILTAYYHKWVIFFTVAISLAAKDSFYLCSRWLSVLFASMFIAAICMMILQFFVDIVFYSSDGLIYCYVLAAESGQDVASGEMREFHEIIQDVKAQNAESEPFADKLPDDQPTQQPATSFVPAADVIV